VASIFSSDSYVLHAGFLLGLFFEHGDGGEMSSQNVGILSTDDTPFIYQKIELFNMLHAWMK
jgi:hypothetical protein